MNKLISSIKSMLFSTRLMSMLFLLFAGSMAVATFIENDFGTPTARVLVYNSWWFEAIMVFFVINFVGNIVKFKLLRPKKIITLIFHLSFILILVGAWITRYVSYEGMVVIKEGETTSHLLTQRTYLQVHIDNDEVQLEEDKEVEFSKVKPDFFNNFKINTDFKGQDVSVKYVDYLEGAESDFVENEEGDKFLHFVESTGGERNDYYIKDGDFLVLNRTTVGFNSPSEQGLNIVEKEGKFFLETSADGSFFRMKDKFQGSVYKDSVQGFNLLTLYNLQGLQFVIPTYAVRGEEVTVAGNGSTNQLIVDVTANGETKRVAMNGGQYMIEPPNFFSLGGLNFRLAFGSKYKEMPFAVKLNDFQLEKYPGSESPKSYASEVTVIDKADGKTFDFRIFMNNILDYKGFKLFQSSYNITPEYEETRLSLNHDFWGTWITYIGYTLLYIAMTLLLFVPGSRFVNLKDKLNKINAKKAALSVVFALFTFVGFSQHNAAEINIDSLLQGEIASVEHADKFGHLVIQEESGRMQPFNTFSSQLVRKVSKKDHYNEYTADQVGLSMVLNPRIWYAVPMIYMEKGNTQVRDLLGIDHDQKHARLIDFFDMKGAYKLKEVVSESHKTQIKSKFQKDVINIDKRSNLLYAALDGSLFKFFPLPNDAGNKWFSAVEAPSAGFTGMDSTIATSILYLYDIELTKAIKGNNYAEADKILGGISSFQTKYGGSVMPSIKQVNFEMLYNKYDVFKKLFWQYLLVGSILFILVLIRMFKDNKTLKILTQIFIGLIIALFLLQFTALGVRWYISGHAPWSNAYESMIYISFATMFFGLALGKDSSMTIAASTFVTSMMLMIAHWNWMDPTIGNLVPVLNSYWLMIHVAIIVASYGPFAVGMITGFMSLILMIFTTENNKKRLKLNIDELTVVTEMALTLGLVMLTIGNFLGGQWANESWGRYWGWDPKETWALISIMIYAFVIHARFVPGLRGKWTFNVFAVFSFTSVLMTYLGVNHLLSGLHSYAAGEKAAIPNQIWASLAVAVVVSILAYFKYKKYYAVEER
jgi:cytochrome c-type biogenesis protein CcsB